MKSNPAKFYFLASGFSAARMGIGATSVVYMMSKGISLSDIAVIKIVQAIVIIFAEVPTGLVADTFGRKMSVLLACITSLISFAFFVNCESLIGFSIAEIFNGLCIAFWSGSFEALFVEKTKATQQEGSYIEFLFARVAAYSALATMLGGLAGGVLGEKNLLYPFYMAAGLMLFMTCFVLISIPSDSGLIEALQRTSQLTLKSRVKNVFSNMKKHHENAWKFALSSEPVRYFFIIQIAIQFSIQPVLHYWQPYFQSFSSGVTTQLLGWIFFAYVGGQFVVSGLISQLLERKIVTPERLNTISVFITTLGFFLLWVSQNVYIAIFIFVVLQAAMGAFRNNIGASFNRFVSNSDRATVLSSVSFISRFGMLLNLAILKFTAGLYPVSWVFLTSLLTMMSLIPLVFIWNGYSQRVRLHA